MPKEQPLKIIGYVIEYKAKEEKFWRKYLDLYGISLNSAMEELESRRGNAPLRQWRLIECRIIREYGGEE